jgi:hypothetical protein
MELFTVPPWTTIRPPTAAAAACSRALGPALVWRVHVAPSQLHVSSSAAAPKPPNIIRRPVEALAHARPLHVWFAAQSKQARPPLPHAVSRFPGWQSPPLQHPEHDVASHVHAPSTQRCPSAQEPALQMPPQPSLCPQALPAQLGVHPHTPVMPPPPQERGEEHWRAQQG